MHFTNFIVAAILATSSMVSAAPRPEAEAEALADPTLIDLGGLLNKIFPKKCPGNSYWVGWFKTCKCENDRYYSYNSQYGRCERPKYDNNGCGINKTRYCAANYDEYTVYNRNSEYCNNDAYSVSFCSSPIDLKKNLGSYCPPDKSKDCKKPRYYNWKTNSCECKDGKVWYDNRCVYKPHNEPYCTNGEKAYCAKNENNYTPYSKWHDYCGDNGSNYVFCSKDPKSYCEKKWYYN